MIITKKITKTTTKLGTEQYESDPAIDAAIRAYPDGQAKLAVKIGINPDMLSKVLNGSRTLKEEYYKKLVKLLINKP
jgi:hypothetical protein